METVDLTARPMSKRVQLKTIVTLIVVVTTGALGSVCLRVGMKHDVIHASLAPYVLLREFHGFVANAWVWLGILFRAVSGFAFMCLLSWADYSYVNPAASSAYIITVFFGWVILGEVVPPARWIGTLLITLGVVFISLTPANTTGQAAGNEKESGAPKETPRPQTASRPKPLLPCTANRRTLDSGELHGTPATKRQRGSQGERRTPGSQGDARAEANH